MATEYQLDPRPFFQILHNLLRQSEIDYAAEDTAKVMDWVRANAGLFRKVTSTAEFGLIMTFWDYWERHTIAPNRQDLWDLTHAKQKCGPMLDVITEYDRHAQDLEVVPVLSLDLHLDQRREDFEKWKLSRIIQNAEIITTSSLQMNDKERTIYTGPRDALKYFQQAMEQGILLADTAKNIEGRYERTEMDAQNNNLFIPTGISLIDAHLGGMRRKEFNGFLGFVGQRKSAVVRTIAYNAAASGFRVLHIPLESDYEEEETIYAVMHARANSWVGVPDYCAISKARVDRSLLTDHEKEYFFKKVVPSYQESIARYISIYTPGASRSWVDVKAIIERENSKEPIDLVIVDYLTMLATPGARDDATDKTAIIQDAKRLALTINDGRGLCLVTPVQGSRNGYDEAAERDGAWSLSGIGKYNEIEKSLDNCFYIFVNDTSSSGESMKMGSCKTRRGPNIPASFVNVDPDSGYVTGRASGKGETGALDSAGNEGGSSEDKSQRLIQEMTEMLANITNRDGDWI